MGRAFRDLIDTAVNLLHLLDVYKRQLDITLFASRIAPLFHITKRFAGEEPLDPVTRDYRCV